jgi:hypothetical protein
VINQHGDGGKSIRDGGKSTGDGGKEKEMGVTQYLYHHQDCLLIEMALGY